MELNRIFILEDKINQIIKWGFGVLRESFPPQEDNALAALDFVIALKPYNLKQSTPHCNREFSVISKH